MVEWLEGRIKEVAAVLNKLYGITNITYETTPNKVVFLHDGFYFGSFEGKSIIKKF